MLRIGNHLVRIKETIIRSCILQQPCPSTVMKMRSLSSHLGRQSVREGHLVSKGLEHPSSPASSTSPLTKDEWTPLASHIRDLIKLEGPMSVAQYMRIALTHPLGGYYTRGDVFGAQGDFITSPEISQLFGEMIGIWIVYAHATLSLMYNRTLRELQALPSSWGSRRFPYLPQKLRLLELGPGRGTLMRDILSVYSTLTSVKKDMIVDVLLIEASPFLRTMQAKTLNPSWKEEDKSTVAHEGGEVLAIKTKEGITVRWYESVHALGNISQINTNLELGTSDPVYPIWIAHEFFDAMPIYKFEKTEMGWRELLVDLNQNQNQSELFTLVRAPASTKASVALLTPEVLERFSHLQVGDRIELSPDTDKIISFLAKHISITGSDHPSRWDIPTPPNLETTPYEDVVKIAEKVDAVPPKFGGGCAIIMDYGAGYTPADSLRGFRGHALVSPFSKVGESDITANVDFGSISRVASSNPDQRLYPQGPITQRDFLESMGIRHRLRHLQDAILQKTPKPSTPIHDPAAELTSTPLGKALQEGVDRLTDKLSMGSQYKFLLLNSHRGGIFPFDKRIDLSDTVFIDREEVSPPLDAEFLEKCVKDAKQAQQEEAEEKERAQCQSKEWEASQKAKKGSNSSSA